MALDIVPLGGRLAARIDGLSLSELGRHPDPGVVEEIVGALHEHLVLAFPAQNLDDAALQSFAELFGDLYLHPIARHLGFDRARVEHIIDDADHPPYQDGWHTDVSFDHHPPAIGCLQAIDLPSRGGETLWANMEAALHTLSPALQSAIDGLHGVHAPGLLAAFASKLGEDLAAAIDAQFPGTEHPLVGTHPVTGRRYLYANPTFTIGISGLTAAESQALLRPLFDAAASPNLHYRHRWTRGDVVLWDERATQHFATSDHFPNRREVARVTIA